MSEATHLRLKSLMCAHTDGNDDQHQQVCDSWVIGKTAKDLCDLAAGLGKSGRSFCHSLSSVCFLSAFISTLVAWLALSTFEDFALRVLDRALKIFLVFVGFFVTFGFFPPLNFFFVMRR